MNLVTLGVVGAALFAASKAFSKGTTAQRITADVADVQHLSTKLLQTRFAMFIEFSNPTGEGLKLQNVEGQLSWDGTQMGMFNSGPLGITIPPRSMVKQRIECSVSHAKAAQALLMALLTGAPPKSNFQVQGSIQFAGVTLPFSQNFNYSNNGKV